MKTAIVVKYPNGNEFFAGYLEQSDSGISISETGISWHKATPDKSVDGLLLLRRGKDTYRFTYITGQLSMQVDGEYLPVVNGAEALKLIFGCGTF